MAKKPSKSRKSAPVKPLPSKAEFDATRAAHAKLQGAPDKVVDLLGTERVHDAPMDKIRDAIGALREEGKATPRDGDHFDRRERSDIAESLNYLRKEVNAQRRADKASPDMFAAPAKAADPTPITVPFKGTVIQGATAPAGGPQKWQQEAIRSGKPVYVVNEGGFQKAVDAVPKGADFVTYHPESKMDLARAPFPLAAKEPTYTTLHPENARSWGDPSSKPASPGAAAVKTATGTKPSLGGSVEDIMHNWQSQQSTGSHIVQGRVIGEKGEFSWRNGELWRDTPAGKQLASTRQATKAEEAMVRDAALKGQLEVYARAPGGVTGEKRTGLPTINLHQATGRHLDPVKQAALEAEVRKSIEAAKPAPSGERPGWQDAARTASADARAYLKAQSQAAYDAHLAAAKDMSKTPRERADAIVSTREALQNARHYEQHGAKFGWDEAMQLSKADAHSPKHLATLSKPVSPVSSPVKTGETTDSALRSRIEAVAKTNPEVSKVIGSLNRPEGAKPSEQVTPAKAADAAPRGKGRAAMGSDDVKLVRIPTAKLSDPSTPSWRVMHQGRPIGELQMSGGRFTAVEGYSPLGSGATKEEALASIKQTLARRSTASPPSSGDLTGGAKETAGGVKQLEVTPSSIQTAHDKPAGISPPGKKEPKAKLTKAMGAPIADQEAVLRTMFTGDKPSYRIMDELSSQHTAAIDKLHREGLIAGNHKAGFVLSKQGAQIASKLPEASPKPESSGLHGTQNPNNLEAIVEGKKARAADTPERAAERQRIADGSKRIGDTYKAQPAPEAPKHNEFTSAMKPTAAAKAKAALDMQVRHNGKEFLSRAALIERQIANGAKVETITVGGKPQRVLMGKDGAFLDTRNITKTGLDYAEHLSGKGAAKPASPAPVLPPVKPVEAAKPHMTPAEFAANLRQIRHDNLTRVTGQAAYEADLSKQPKYHDGTPRKTWDQLGPVERSSWDRNPTPKVEAKPVEAKPVATPKPAPKVDPTPTLAAQGVQRGKPAANPVVPAPKAAEPVKAPVAAAKSSKVGKALGALGPVAIGASAIQAAGEARAAGKSTGEIALAGAKAGAETTAGVGGMMLAQGAAVHALVRGGMTVAKAVPGVNLALMAGGAIHGAVTAKPGERLAGAAKGAWDMSLPGMVVNTGKAVKDAAKAWQKPATPSAPHSAPVASFQAAQDRFSAMRAAAQATEAGNKKKGWSNAARIAAYQAKHPGGTALPYGGAVEPPKPTVIAATAKK